MAYVNLSHMPAPRQEYVVNFVDLNGGINLSELEYRLKNKESPEMRNMIWREGVLSGRDGQKWIIPPPSSSLGTAYTMYERLYNGAIFAHIGKKIYYTFPKIDNPSWHVLTTDGVPEHPMADIPEVRGTFFHYFDKLYYKTKGAYVCISQESIEVGMTQGAILVANAVEGYVPVILINADPDTAAGDLYQPENRLSAKKTVWYNANSSKTVYHLPVKGLDAGSDVDVYVGGTKVTTGYTLDRTAGTVTFSTAPDPGDPPANNTVRITYTKTNSDAYNSIMDCPYASTYGGTGDLCVVMGGCPAQPNAYFWNGNNVAMDPTYFPMSQYQLAGDTNDPITGFGKQQSYLVVFKEHSIGRAKMDTATIDERLTIDMPFTAINDKIGCDLPWTIQLIDNNLVWCNTEQGVHVLKDSSYAYENNIMCFSTKISGHSNRLSLMTDVRYSDISCSLDDTKHYWVCANGHAWLWDYENTQYKDPSWYYFTNIKAVAFATELDDVWHLSKNGGLTYFTRSFEDYGGPIDKSYRFTSQNFGGYDRLKNVNSVIIAIRPDTTCSAELTYLTDYETRKDLTPLTHKVWRLIPRDLSYRDLSGSGYVGAVFRRRPMCRRVKHFSMRLDNAVKGEDLSIMSAQIFYNFQGRLK